ncbi:hypothetical protein H5410_025597 [Solanum commersonii]|uniref:Uncharacterized protein n=1 Tax=Solanum commersonii TaxID=4109 RepID=A0A9J5YU78_SOLCO|nr:hypothetical protein H5410_025597 [Solanum commersonii]
MDLQWLWCNILEGGSAFITWRVIIWIEIQQELRRTDSLQDRRLGDKSIELSCLRYKRPNFKKEIFGIVVARVLVVEFQNAGTTTASPAPFVLKKGPESNQEIDAIGLSRERFQINSKFKTNSKQAPKQCFLWKSQNLQNVIARNGVKRNNVDEYLRMCSIDLEAQSYLYREFPVLCLELVKLGQKKNKIVIGGIAIGKPNVVNYNFIHINNC